MLYKISYSCFLKGLFSFQTASFFSTLFERLGDLEEQIIESVKKFTGFFTSYYGNAAPDWQSFKVF